jgi:hypothetical protein
MSRPSSPAITARVVKLRQDAPPETKAEVTGRITEAFREFNGHQEVANDEIEVSGGLAFTRGSLVITLTPAKAESRDSCEGGTSRYGGTKGAAGSFAAPWTTVALLEPASRPSSRVREGRRTPAQGRRSRPGARPASREAITRREPVRGSERVEHRVRRGDLG